MDITAEAYRAALDDRIHQLLVYRRWYRAHPWTLDWPSRQEHAAELRALVKVARRARRVAREVNVSRALAYGDHFAYPEPVA
jgi:hypothetical protein